MPLQDQSVVRRSDCRLCGSRHLEPVFSLTPTPPANALVSADQVGQPQAVYPLDLFFCTDCGHLQLLDVVDPALLFENYVYVSGTSPSFVRHFQDYAGALITGFNLAPDSLVVDIGSNDGTLLKAFKDQGLRVMGVDPAKDIAAKATADGVPTLAEFFSLETARRITGEVGQASVVTANNVFAHADDLAGIVEGVRELLAPDGLFSFEVSYLMDVFEKTLFDTIYHEHLSYHSLKPLCRFLDAQGMQPVKVERPETHGGSLRVISQLKGGARSVDSSVSALVDLEEQKGLDRAETFRGYGAQIDQLRDDLGSLLGDLKARNKVIAAFGAPAKATTLMYHFGLGSGVIDFIVDDSPLKQGLFSPGFHIPILPVTALYERMPDYVLILAWNFATPIMKNNQRYREAGGQFIVPLPKLEVF
ncbi:class I SAM-dependent methyltransferase [Magnetospira sp. QH-2]|uniref:class I SAM-dependent methyltransferase n=1 Tax=Magnetospira sp. (strain QH-2) TaxID=1288970 RepID=UPI0003E80E8B|nr:class I SAM-dependent methyltransferase [Magnetospira sp. QH-2]CCQ75491.1 putative SAM-dependent methyltransferase [Magnetospira sp. QH-2]